MSVEDNTTNINDADEDFELEITDDESEDSQAQTPENPENPENSPQGEADESASEGEGEADESEEGEDDAPAKGTRAERRIRKLIKERRERDRLIAELRRQVEEERSRGQQYQVTTAKTSLDDRLERIKAQETALKAEWRAAQESENPDAMWDINEKLAELKANRMEIVRRKTALEASTGEEYQKPEQKTPQPEAPELDEHTRAWTKRNPWFGKDGVKTQTALAIHSALISEGYDPNDMDDPDYGVTAYYRELDARLGEGESEGAKEKRMPAQPVKKSTVAGASRAFGTQPTKGRVRLTKSEVDLASRMGLSPEEYAREKIRLEKAKQGNA